MLEAADLISGAARSQKEELKQLQCRGSATAFVARCLLRGQVPKKVEGQGQVAQSVEQGTENPRVGGSIPSLATFLLIVAGLGCSDPCRTTCLLTAQAISDCLDEWSADWSDLGAENRAGFRQQCQNSWSQTSVDLEVRELEDALDLCENLVTDVTDTTCDELRAIYLP